MTAEPLRGADQVPLPLPDDEALTLLRGHHAMKESRADVLNWVHEARTSIETLPDGPARAAFLAMCDFVEKRTG